MIKLSDIADLNPRRMLKKGTVAPFVEMASLPVNARDIEHIGEKEFKSGGSKFKNDDVLFARITPCLENGKTAKVSGLADDEIAFGSTEFIVLSAKNSDDKDYLYYLARLPEFRAYAQARMEGTSGRQRVAWQSLAEFEFNFPESEQRKRAGDLLKIFDDKIQLNTETNQTLEAIASALFKSWFIDFDPVRAKADALDNGKTEAQATIEAMKILSGKTSDQLAQLAQDNPKDYQQLQTTAEAFPSGFDDTGIPLGWAVGKFQDICLKIESGGTPKRSEDTYWNGNISWLSSGEVRDEIIIETKEQITPEGLDNSSAKLWSENTTVIAMYGATAGQVCLLSIETTANQACCGLTPKEKHGSFLFFNAKNSIEDLSGKASGSAQQNLNKGLIENHQIYIPNFDIINFFDIATSRLIEKIKLNYFENKMLAETRDELLPKLLNGEIQL